MVYATACVYRELYGKITDHKKSCVLTISFEIKFSYLFSCAEFRAILTPFSEVIWKPLLLLIKGRGVTV